MEANSGAGLQVVFPLLGEQVVQGLAARRKVGGGRRGGHRGQKQDQQQQKHQDRAHPFLLLRQNCNSCHWYGAGAP